jgi:hypothetical protein
LLVPVGLGWRCNSRRRLCDGDDSARGDVARMKTAPIGAMSEAWKATGPESWDSGPGVRYRGVTTPTRERMLCPTRPLKSPFAPRERMSLN